MNTYTDCSRLQAAREYEKHVEQNGKPASHAEAKELLAGLAGAFIDREFETKGVRYYPQYIYDDLVTAKALKATYFVYILI